MLFRDRHHAGQVLAESLRAYAQRSDVIVLGLPRGGVPVAYEVAHALNVPWDVFLVRKLGVPGHEELAMGAIASGGVCVVNEAVVQGADVSEREFKAVAKVELRELARRERAFRGERQFPELKDRVVILVDDGLATGSTMRAASQAVRHFEPARLVVAVPVAAESTCKDFRREVDEVVCSSTPQPFYAVGMYYEDFSQTTDEEVWDLLGHKPTSAPEIETVSQTHAGPIVRPPHDSLGDEPASLHHHPQEDLR